MKITISLDDQLAEQVRRAAADAGISVNAFVTRTLSDAVKRREPPEALAFDLITVRGVRRRPGIDLDLPRALDINEDVERFRDATR